MYLVSFRQTISSRLPALEILNGALTHTASDTVEPRFRTHMAFRLKTCPVGGGVSLKISGGHTLPSSGSKEAFNASKDAPRARVFVTRKRGRQEIGENTFFVTTKMLCWSTRTHVLLLQNPDRPRTRNVSCALLVVSNVEAQSRHRLTTISLLIKHSTYGLVHISRRVPAALTPTPPLLSAWRNV